MSIYIPDLYGGSYVERKSEFESIDTPAPLGLSIIPTLAVILILYCSGYFPGHKVAVTG